MRSEVSAWLSDCAEKITVAGTYNLPGNITHLVKLENAAAITVEKLYNYDGLTFVPFEKANPMTSVLAWKKSANLSPSGKIFHKTYRRKK